MCIHFVKAELHVFNSCWLYFLLLGETELLYILKQIGLYIFWSKSVNTFKSIVADKNLFARVTFRRVELQTRRNKWFERTKQNWSQISADIIHISLQIIGPAHSMNVV